MFQNRDDMTTLFPAGSRLGQHAIFTPGSGVDLRRFAEPASKLSRLWAANVPTVLFVGRVIAEKGIREFVAAAEQCGRNGVSARFVVCGDADEALGDSLYEAQIFVRGQVKELGADCVEKELRDEHLAVLAELLERGEVKEAKPEEFRRYGSARQLYNFKVDNASRY